MRRLSLLACVALLLCLSLGSFAQKGSDARPAITGVAFLRVYSTHPEEAQHFYGQILGYNRIEQGDTWAYPVNRSQWIEILPHTPPPHDTDRIAAFGISVADVAAMERFVKAHGIAVVDPLHDGEFSVLDPEGYKIVFVQSPLHKGAPLGGIPLAVSKTAPSPNAISTRIIHVGMIVHDRAKEDGFYRTLLGFKPYWIGGSSPDKVQYVSQQVPDGHDWIEYMLSYSTPPMLANSGVLDHTSLAVDHIEQALSALDRNGADFKIFTPMKIGVDGKVQLNLYDPDLTRIEIMDYQPAAKPCCTPFTAPHPSPSDPH